MTTRKGIDWTKPFKLITSKEEFDRLGSKECLLGTQTRAVHSKQQNLWPEAKLNETACQEHKFFKIRPNYVRHLTYQHKKRPSPNYELSQTDVAFLNTHQDRFWLNSCRVLSEEFLRKVIIQLQLKAGKGKLIPQSKGWITAIFQKEHTELLQMEAADQFSSIVYNYWKQRRQQYDWPVLHQLWKPQADQRDYNIAYRPREKDKRVLRRSSRVPEGKLLFQLGQQFSQASKLVLAVQRRQELKLRQVSMQLNSFYSECKEFASLPEQIQEAKAQNNNFFENKFKLLIRSRRSLKKKQNGGKKHRKANQKSDD